MKLYLVRHGEALPREVDPACSLSDNGRAEVARTSEAFTAKGVDVARVIHSGKTRAEETAKLLASVIGPGVPVTRGDGLNPLDPVGPIARMVNGLNEDTMLVGHLPFMGTLTTLLVTGEMGNDIFLFTTACVACLERSDDDRWSLAWTFDPGGAGLKAR